MLQIHQHHPFPDLRRISRRVVRYPMLSKTLESPTNPGRFILAEALKQVKPKSALKWGLSSQASPLSAISCPKMPNRSAS